MVGCRAYTHLSLLPLTLLMRAGAGLRRHSCGDRHNDELKTIKRRRSLRAILESKYIRIYSSMLKVSVRALLAVMRVSPTRPSQVGDYVRLTDNHDQARSGYSYRGSEEDEAVRFASLFEGVRSG